MRVVSFGFGFMILILFVSIGILVYYMAYSRRINRMIQNGFVPKYKMLSPLKFATIVIIGILAVFGIFLSIMTLRSDNTTTMSMDDRYYEGNYDFKVYEDTRIPEYLSVYNIVSNPGYEKKQETKGDLRYTYFISKEKYDWFHPSLIMFIEYTGKSDIVTFEYNGKFLTPEESPEVIRGIGLSGGSFNKYIMVVCSRSVDSIFSFEISMSNNYEKHENLGDGALVHDTIALYWENRE